MQTTLVSAIVAHGTDLAIGANNQLLWHLPADFKWFVQHTKNKTICMGRNTMQSLPGPLKNRTNLVLSSTNTLPLGFEHLPHLPTFLKETTQPEIMIIGGAQVYSQFLPLVNRIYATIVHANFPNADTFFPAYEKDFECIYKAFNPIDEKHAFSFELTIWDRIHTN